MAAEPRLQPLGCRAIAAPAPAGQLHPDRQQPEKEQRLPKEQEPAVRRRPAGKTHRVSLAAPLSPAGPPVPGPGDPQVSHRDPPARIRSEEHTSELPSLMRI